MPYGKNEKNFQFFSPPKLLVTIIQHMAEQTCTQQVPESDTIDSKSCSPQRIPLLMWRECIKKMWKLIH